MAAVPDRGAAWSSADDDNLGAASETFSFQTQNASTLKAALGAAKQTPTTTNAAPAAPLYAIAAARDAPPAAEKGRPAAQAEAAAAAQQATVPPNDSTSALQQATEVAREAAKVAQESIGAAQQVTTALQEATAAAQQAAEAVKEATAALFQATNAFRAATTAKDATDALLKAVDAFRAASVPPAAEEVPPPTAASVPPAAEEVPPPPAAAVPPAAEEVPPPPAASVPPAAQEVPPLAISYKEWKRSFRDFMDRGVPKLAMNVSSAESFVNRLQSGVSRHYRLQKPSAQVLGDAFEVWIAEYFRCVCTLMDGRSPTDIWSWMQTRIPSFAELPKSATVRTVTVHHADSWIAFRKGNYSSGGSSYMPDGGQREVAKIALCAGLGTAGDYSPSVHIIVNGAKAPFADVLVYFSPQFSSSTDGHLWLVQSKLYKKAMSQTEIGAEFHKMGWSPGFPETLALNEAEQRRNSAAHEHSVATAQKRVTAAAELKEAERLLEVAETELRTAKEAHGRKYPGWKTLEYLKERWQVAEDKVRWVLLDARNGDQELQLQEWGNPTCLFDTFTVIQGAGKDPLNLNDNYLYPLPFFDSIVEGGLREWTEDA